MAKAERHLFAPVSGRGSIWFKLGIWIKSTRGQYPYVMRHEYTEWAQKCEGDVLRSGTGIWEPSTNWSQGGPISERELIATEPSRFGWKARYSGGGYVFGETPLIAAMRCFVASKLGAEIEIPEALL